jgi:hypothetical protein
MPQASTTGAAQNGGPRCATAALALERWSAFFVWAVWASMSVGLILFIARYGCNLPFGDEWEQVPVLTGARPCTLDWLLLPHNQHRVPLVRVLHLALTKLSGNDFRAAMVGTALSLSALAFAMIRIARRLRGHASYLDAVFPLVLLHFGHRENLLEGWDIHNSLFTVLASVVLLVIATARNLATARLLLAAVCLVLLTLLGAGGASLVPGIALWVGWLVLVNRRAGAITASRSLVTLIVTAMALGVAFLAWWTIDRSTTPGKPPDLDTTSLGALMFLTAGLGNAAAQIWPLSGILVACLYLVGTACLMATSLRQPRERPRLAGYLFFLFSMGGLAALVAHARAGITVYYCLEERYGLLAAPGLCALYLSATTSWRRASGRAFQVALFLVVWAVAAWNLKLGLDEARASRLLCDAFQEDLLDGKPAEVLVDRHGWLVGSWDGHPSAEACAEVRDCFCLLQDAGIGIFRHLRRMPPHQRLALSIVPAQLMSMSWEKDTARGHGTDPSLTFRLDRPRHVYGIVLRCSLNYGNSCGTPANFRIAWKPDPARKYFERSDRVQIDTSRGLKTVRMWVDDRIDQFEIRPDDKPCVLRLAEIILQVEPEEGNVSDR